MYFSFAWTGTNPTLTVGMREKRAWMRFLWVITTPLGTPVEPEVYMMMAESLGSGGEEGMEDLEPIVTTSDILWKVVLDVGGGVGSAL